ncbi:Eukaryotic translation initiation factor 3 subunit M [Lachnellula willkommii]|uniref:Eukaryotic translation initiation factor 3 subunit M n=2 Tax=Lachnellula TaxID=47830 RepID=A0A559MKZ8_9HELO|nr:Eukaryotic translation initiation factor 3 subunit M [Lachnellula willkommii]
MGRVENKVRHVDVLIVGGGPVGLVLAYQLAKFGHSSSIAIIEKHAKSSQDQYGRAITLYPRSTEMLDQLDLADELAQECFACRDTVSYDKDGNEVHGRGWYFMENMKDTQWDFALVLRQKYQEEIFRRRLREEGVSLEAPVELVSVTVDENTPSGGHRITALLKNGVTGEEETVICKYLIGADGGRSFVRRALEIPFEGSTTEDKWVDWFTVYSVGQRVAKEFFTKDCIFLAGDACHTHSSGAAQGMNTGMHDAVNLAWKLSMVLRGLAPSSLLSTYESERLPNVQKLINYDKDISRLMTMQLPVDWSGDPNADPNEILGTVMEEASTFTSGLSIAFDSNNVNVPGTFKSNIDPAPVISGQRGPDVFLHKPGTFEATRLHKETPNIARFHAIVFAGEPEHTSVYLKEFSAAWEKSKMFSGISPISWLTVPAKSSPSAYELLGVAPFGKVFYDKEQTAHSRYGINVKEGAIFVMRPDGWVATAAALGGDAVEELEVYFKNQQQQQQQPPPIMQYCFVEGNFADLSRDLAEYLRISTEIEPLLEANTKDEVLKKLVTASAGLNAYPEKEFTAAYNLLVYLVMQSPNVNMFLPRMCEHLSKPITSAPLNGSGLALNVLTTIFNLLQPDNDVRWNVFSAILRLVKNSGNFEVLRPQLKKLDQWIEEWELDEEDQRKLYGQLADVAEDAGEQGESYQFILKALRTFPASEVSSKEAQDLSLRALKAALISSTHFDFHDLTSLPTIQALSDSHAEYSELLEIFSEKELEDYTDFRDENEDWIEKEALDNSALHRKMRLLTLASVAASTNSKELEYKRIAKALQVPVEDVEMWVIDVIRAQLIEGKLSQQKQVFLIHRTTYRVFGEKQWREVATRLDTWRSSLRAVKEVISRERQQAEAQKERELHEAERKIAGASGMGAGRRAPGGRDNMIEMGTD